jgi:hypothetical protein
VRNCLTDEGRPLGTGLQGQDPNHLRRLWSKAMVVSTEGKGLARTRSGDRQEEDRKGTTVEVSKAKRWYQNRWGLVTAGLAPTKPGYGRSGIRHERWLCQAGNCQSAVIRQSKTCRGCSLRSSGDGSNITGDTIARPSTRPCAIWIETWSCGPSGNTRSCVPIYGERHTGSHVSRVALRSCSPTGRWECGEAP